ncbi:shikimate kinase [uncultured Desulfuromusa sp.]|uniref:shikimate kinase n=1 Tax=uncultured Desulfuromusa sp. TaxID=219183 RepID=UPI002AA8C0F0|nr:shikimate kinase [uncultured Desulfuromusa sp.]
MPRHNIILTGFMGTGKTTLGRLLAKRIDYDFVDTDTLIEEQTGLSIAKLFETRGETAFRKLEANLVEDLALKEGQVLATGGGLVLNPHNVKVLAATGHIICLTAAPEDILARVSQQQNLRPLLSEKDPQTKINELLRQRDTVYKQFPQLSTSAQTLEQLIDKLLKLIDALPSPGAVSL